MSWTSVQFTVGHLYKRAQFWLQVGFYPTLLSLQWEYIGMKQYVLFWSTSLIVWEEGCPPSSLPYFTGGTRPGNLHIAEHWREQFVSWSDFNEEKEY